MATTEQPNISSELGSLPADAISYEDLYARWERGNWKATELDFTEDARQWQEEFSEFERTAAIWNYALFFWGEDAVADNLSPYIDAAPREEQKYFLATQQVDEARHAVFFKRFMHEVAGIGDGSMASGLNAIKPQLSPGFRKIFERLDRMADELRADHSPAKLAAAVTLYHIVVEGTLAQPGQHLICSYLEERDKLPAFREGMQNIQVDEQRHIGFGVKLLADLRREDPVRVPKAVAGILHDVTRYTAQVLMPPGWDESYLTVFGYTFDKIGPDGVNSLTTKLRSAGMPAETLPGPPLFPPASRRWNSPSAGAVWLRRACSACARAPRCATPKRWNCCSTRCAARSTPTTGCAARPSFSGSSPIPTSPPGTSPCRTAPPLSPRGRRRAPTCACGSPGRTSSTSSAPASPRCARSPPAACARVATRSG